MTNRKPDKIIEIKNKEYACFKIYPVPPDYKAGEIWLGNDGKEYLIKFINNPGDSHLRGAVYYKCNYTCQGPEIHSQDFYSYIDENNKIIVVPDLITKSENQNIFDFLEIKRDKK